MAVNIAEVYGYCPVQAKGTIHGTPFHFRARWDEWELIVSDDLDTVLSLADPGLDQRTLYYRRELYCPHGTFADASWMEHDTARRLILACEPSVPRPKA